MASSELTIEDVAKVMGISVERARQLIAVVKKKKLIPLAVKRSGHANLYSSSFVTKLANLRNSGKFGKPRNRSGSQTVHKGSGLTLSVIITDVEAIKILTNKFGSQDQIQKFLKSKLEDIYQPIMKKLTALEKKYQAEKEAAFKSL